MIEHGVPRATWSLVILVAGALALLWTGSPKPASAASGTVSLTVQTMDSCKKALDGAGYALSGGSLGSPITVLGSGNARQTVSSGSCPVPRGSCTSTHVGCLTIPGVPVPGSYRIDVVQTPPANSTNPQGYAPCEGGSACRSQEAAVTVAADGSVQATVTDVYPDGSVRVFPGSGSYAGTPSDPVVFHLFGLGTGSCDGENDADDHLTGSPSTHCGYSPEGGESSACQPYPWSCSSSISSTSSTTSTTTTTTTTTTSTTSTTTTTTSTASTTSSTSGSSTTACATTKTFAGTDSGGTSTSEFIDTTAAGPLTASVTWTPATTADLIVYDSSLHVLGQTSGSSGSLSLTLPSEPPSSYKVKVKDPGSSSIRFSLTVTHC